MEEPAQLIYVGERFNLVSRSLGMRGFEFIEALNVQLGEAKKICSVINALNHPGILQVLKANVVEEEEHIVIRTLYAYEQLSLADFIAQGGKPSVEDVEMYALQLLEVLDYMCRKGVHHSNIRPEFILLSRDRKQLKLGFFPCHPSEALCEFELQTTLVRDSGHDIEAAAAGLVIIFLALRRPPFELLGADKETRRQFIDMLPTSELIKGLVLILLQASERHVDFKWLIRSFKSGSVSEDSLNESSVLVMCEKCEKRKKCEAIYVLQCGHRFCADHEFREKKCPICALVITTSLSTPTLSPEDQMREFMKHLVTPALSLADLRMIPQTINPRRFIISTLAEVHAEAANVLKVLRRLYTSWRSSNADGNSFYRCMGVAWMEKIFRSNCPVEALQKRIAKLEKRIQPFCATQKTASQFSQVIGALRRISQCPRGEQMNNLQQYLQNPQFDESLIVFIRTVTSNFVLGTNNPSSEVDSVRMSLLQFGSECPPSSPIILFTGQALRYNIEIYDVSSSAIALGTDNDASKTGKEKSNRVALFLVDGVYHLLYSVTQDYLDGYNHVESCCHPLVFENQQVSCRFA